MAIADRIVLMDRGKMFNSGMPGSSMRGRAAIYRGISGSINFLKARLVEPRGSGTDPRLVRPCLRRMEILFPAHFPSLPRR